MPNSVLRFQSKTTIKIGIKLEKKSRCNSHAVKIMCIIKLLNLVNLVFVWKYRDQNFIKITEKSSFLTSSL